MTSRTLKSILMATVAVGGVSFAKVASAQEAAKADEKVTVTGTRIRQRDFTSTSPIATVSSKDIALTGTVNVESLINDLPQIVPGLTVTSNNPSLNGFATADLRGLGVGRTLILVNGRRANPSDRSGAVDLNTIPASLIERIEIISGGASAVYGADAVAGAINFIMRDSFEGVQVSASFQQAEDGEAPALVVDGIMGGKFDSGRGSLMIGLQYYSRQPVQADKREWSRHTSAAMLTAAGDVVISYDPSSFLANNPGSSVFNPAGSGTAPWTSLTGGFSGANVIAASGDVLDADCNPANGIQATGGTIRFTADGQISPFQNCGFAANNNQSEPRNVSDRYNFAPDNYLILENERVNAAVYGKYDIVEGGVMQAFVEANFTNTRSVQQLAATPVTGLTFRADIDPAVGNVVINPYITANAEFLALVNLQYPGAALDNRTFTLNIRPNQGGFRVGTAETNAIGLTYGLRGNMPSLDWDWEIYHGFARNTTNIVAENNVGATAMRQLINACGVTSLAVQAQPLLTLPNCPFPNKAGETFVPTGNTNNPLSLNGMNAAQLAFINVDTTDVTVYERNVLSGSVTGDLWDLWGAGAIGMAMGVEYREESLSSKADPFKAAGDIFGFNAQESIAGKFDVYEAYAEAKVPLLTGVTLFDNLSIEAGYRVSDYSTGAGISQTWKYGVEWSIFEWLTLRAIENHAVRAPTAFELFQAGDQNFPGYGDPCNSVAVNALAPALQPARIATCTAWFAAGGAAYGAVHPAPGFAQVNSQVEAFQIGTQSLQPEIADTLTYGIVFNPEWWPVGRIGLSVDRYEIEIAGVIALRSIANILNGCVDSGGVGPDCLLAPRQADGQIDFVNQTRANANTLETSGIDVNLRWQTELDGLGLPGTFGVQSLYTWVDTYLFNGGENVGFHDGTIGGGIPEHRAATNFTYALDDFNFLVRWTYTGRMEQASFGTEQVDAYNMYDFGSSWDIDENFQVSFGVENIFDTKPQTFADAQIFGQFNTDGSTYDQLGRQYRFGIRWKN